MQKMLEGRTKQMKDWKIKYNIKTQEEAQAEQRRIEQARREEQETE